MRVISSIYFMGGRKNCAPKKKKNRSTQNNFEYPTYFLGMGKEFYKTREWRELRWKVLSKSNGLCSMCGRGKQHGVVLHVDHKKPRSRVPRLELVEENLQVLCEDCNIGKGAN